MSSWKGSLVSIQLHTPTPFRWLTLSGKCIRSAPVRVCRMPLYSVALPNLLLGLLECENRFSHHSSGIYTKLHRWLRDLGHVPHSALSQHHAHVAQFLNGSLQLLLVWGYLGFIFFHGTCLSSFSFSLDGTHIRVLCGGKWQGTARRCRLNCLPMFQLRPICINPQSRSGLSYVKTAA